MIEMREMREMAVVVPNNDGFSSFRITFNTVCMPYDASVRCTQFVLPPGRPKVSSITGSIKDAINEVHKFVCYVGLSHTYEVQKQTNSISTTTCRVPGKYLCPWRR
jgi:hypothetical protein